jgi:lambda repressor-like predicted transcriptional regulator
MPSPPIDIVVMSLRNRGASVEEIARRAGLSPREAAGALVRVASRFDPPADRPHPVEA